MQINNIRNTDYYQNTLISEYHRAMGPAIKANDIDALTTMTNNYNSPSLVLNEYGKNKKPLALIEYKHFNIKEVHLYELEPNINLATMAGIPYFLIIYWLMTDHQTQIGKRPLLQNQFYCAPMNKIGSDIILANKEFIKLDEVATIGHNGEGFLSDFSFHQLQYHLRGESFNDISKSDNVNFNLPLPQFYYD